MKNKKIKIAIIGIIALVLVTIGITYAYWLITRTQQGENMITTGCLDISLSGENDITLGNQFPISDEDGMKLTPYRFTVTNNCNTSVDYQVALEALEAGDEISSDALKVALDNKSKLYSAYSTVDATESTAYEARKMLVGTLAPKNTEGSSKTHELRVWIDADAPISEMNKTFKSKIAVTAGQGINNPLKEGSLAYNIVSTYGNPKDIITLPTTFEEKEVYISTDTIYPGDYPYDEKRYWGTTYEFDDNTGTYTLTGEVINASFEECLEGQKKCGNYYVIDRYGNYAQSGRNLIKLFFTETENSNEYPAEYRSCESKFENGTTASENNLYSAQDDLGTSYYFRGNPTNNYVKFGKWTEEAVLWSGEDEIFPGETKIFGSLEECENDLTYYSNCTAVPHENAGKDMYWRIVRINGDGTIRLIYDGVESAENGEEHEAAIAISVYNNAGDDKKYVGYVYDSNNTSSTIKSVVETWYETNLEADYGNFVADSIFCNDREITSTSESDQYYGAYDRLVYRFSPNFVCVQTNDRLSVTNGQLIYPVGLLTADEAVAAGTRPSGEEGSYSYLGGTNAFHTMTPKNYFSGGAPYGGANIFGVENGNLITWDNFVYDELDVRPVINLKADVQFTGNGTIDSPYEIVMN